MSRERAKKVVSKVWQPDQADQRGNYWHRITFEDSSEAIFVSPNNNLFIKGQEAEFEYERKEYQSGKNAGKQYIRVYRIKDQNYSGGKSYSGKKSYGKKIDERTMLLAYAKDIMVAFINQGMKSDPIEIAAEVINIADAFEGWYKGESEPLSPQNDQNGQENKESAGESKSEDILNQSKDAPF